MFSIEPVLHLLYTGEYACQVAVSTEKNKSRVGVVGNRIFVYRQIGVQKGYRSNIVLFEECFLNFRFLFLGREPKAVAQSR